MFSNLLVSCTQIYLNVVILTVLKAHMGKKKKSCSKLNNCLQKREELRHGVSGEWRCPGDTPRHSLKLFSPGLCEKLFRSSTVLGGELGKGLALLLWRLGSASWPWELTPQHGCYLILLICSGDNNYKITRHWATAFSELWYVLEHYSGVSTLWYAFLVRIKNTWFLIFWYSVINSQVLSIGIM